MDIYNVISLCGGLALFLYGMSVLGSGLEKLSGGRLEGILEKMTDNVIKGVMLGALVTAAVQSSSATTVIVVGLVNAGILKLRQAIGVIMGANIGTTITAHILRMTDISSDNLILNLLKPVNLSPIIALIGIFIASCWVFCPKWFSSLLYIGMGWTCVLAFGKIIGGLSHAQFAWLLAGGIIYTIGGLIYALKLPIFNNKHKNFGSHEIFHLFVMGGSFCHFILMFSLL